MRRSLFIAIVIIGGIIMVLAVLFLVLRNPYGDINPSEPESDEVQPLEQPLNADESAEAELITVLSQRILGATTGIDGVRLVYFDQTQNKIKASEFDGTGEQDLSEQLLGVVAMEVAPSKDRAWLQIDDPETDERITLIYDFRAREAIRLENGIKAIDWSPDGASLVYYLEREGSAPSLKVVSSSGLEPRSLRDNFVLQDPVLEWYGQDDIAFWLRPSSVRPSAIVTMKANGTQAIELSNEAASQQALFSPDGQKALISFNDATTDRPVLSMLDVATRTLTTIELSTWIDKCAWTATSDRALCFVPQDLPAGFVYPDNAADDLNFKDRLWSIERDTAKPQRIYDMPEYIADAVLPFLSKDAVRINFLNREFETLVSLDLTGKIVAPIIAPEEQTNEDETSTTEAPQDGSAGTNTRTDSSTDTGTTN
jgi:hypothetical protein